MHNRAQQCVASRPAAKFAESMQTELSALPLTFLTVPFVALVTVGLHLHAQPHMNYLFPRMNHSNTSIVVPTYVSF